MERIDGRIIHDVYLDRVVFRETFTGDGTEDEFTLSGPDAAQVTFKYGAWAVANVKTTLPSHVTKTTKKPAYDSLIPLTRTRIAVDSISAAGVVTLNEPPRAIDFYIWYWYDLPNHHLLEDYYREDFVASMEEEATAYGVDITVDTTDFAGIFTGTDDTVQKAFDTADDHIHDGRYYTETELADQTAGSEGSKLIGFHSHTLHDHLLHLTNKGVMEGCVVSDVGTLDITWTSGMIWDSANEVTMTIASGSATCTNNAVNYLYADYSVSTTVLQRSTTFPAETDMTLVAIIWCQDSDIWQIEHSDWMNLQLADLHLASLGLFPSRVVSGMTVSEDENVDNTLDVTMAAGVLYHGNHHRETIAQVDTRTTLMVRHFHTATAWDSDTNAEIDTANYDNGTQKTDAAPANWFKAVFLYTEGKLHWVYPRVVYATRAQALGAPIPAIPPGLTRAAYLTAIVYNADDTTFATTDWIDIRVGLAEAIATAPVTNHDYLAGISADDHHAQSHAIVSHSDIVDATGANIEELTGGGATTLHSHAEVTTFTAVNTALATANAAIDINSQALTSVGTIGCGAITSSGTLGLGANSITMSGSIGVTGTRVTKLWATAVEVSSAAGLTIAGTGIGSIYAAVAQTMYIGTTQVAINRSSATLNLAGIGTLGCGAITLGGDLITDRWESSGTNTYLGVGVVGTGNASGALYNTFLGNEAGKALTSGDGNIGIGYRALLALTEGSHNIALGFGAAISFTTGGADIGYNIAMGVYAMRYSNGAYNVCIGPYAGEGASGQNFDDCMFLGYGAGQKTSTGDYNVAVGHGALGGNATGASNVAIGQAAAQGVANNSFSGGTFIGFEAGKSITTGGNNICIGYRAGDVLTSGTGNIIIGYDIDPSANNATNEINIGGVYKGDTSTTVPSFGTYAALDGEAVAGYITIKDLAGNDRKVAVVA